MKKTIALIAIAGLTTLPGVAAAKDSTGCGLGTLVFDGQSGVAPQVLAITTNGTSGNQTFGITTGTLGCDSDGTIDHQGDTLAFTSDNLDQLAADVAAGDGETLATVGDMIGVDSAQQDRFARVMQDNFERIFDDADATANEVLTSMKRVMQQDAKLSSALS
jgi:hypothetical protein